MAIITRALDAVLYDVLYNKWESEFKPGWVVINPIHYKVSFDTTGEPQFEQYSSSRALLDSRSTTGSKSASYNKLDNG